LMIGGSLQDPSVLAGKDFVVVQELFETETTAHADVVLPAASFAEIDGTYTNNAGNVQRVRKAIEAVHQAKPDWMITAAIAREMGMDLGFEASASGVFRTLADSVAPYNGLRYPMMKDESEPVQAKYDIAQRGLAGVVEGMKKHLDELQPAEKISEVKHIGHKLHRLTTMTSKTPQFHLLAQGNPKPESLLVSPLAQFGLNGDGEKELAAAVGIKDRV
jgi:anaerobic selenocysteine-containing dehydrogenase